MRKPLYIILRTLLLLLPCALVSCTIDAYETGDGDYSFVRADFSVITTNASAEVSSFVTDENKRYELPSPVTIEGLKADTTYRALVYFDENSPKGLKLRGLTSVLVAQPKPLKNGEAMKTDPLSLASIWVSANGAYINLALNMMVGVKDENATAKQILGFVPAPKKPKHHYLTLLHDQNNVPEYFTHTTYLSIPVEGNFKSGDEVTISINTYEGILEKTVLVP